MAGQVVEEVAPESGDGRSRAEIRKRLDGTFAVVLLRYIDEVVPGYGHVASTWEEAPASTSITDSLDAARAIARELLR